jgi:hypothetical protein
VHEYYRAAAAAIEPIVSLVRAGLEALTASFPRSKTS